MTHASLSDYTLFSGISAEDLKVLLPCLNASLVPLAEGAETTWKPEHTGLILLGRILAEREEDDSECSREEYCEGMLLQFDSLATLQGSKHTLILKMDRRMMFSPCWFSCSFHHRVMSNADLLTVQGMEPPQRF